MKRILKIFVEYPFYGKIVVAILLIFGIVHGDLKLSNIMIDSGADKPRTKLVMIDSDDVRFNKRMTLRRRAKNLCQMINTFPKRLGKWPILRFLIHYRIETGLSKAELKRTITYDSRH